MLERAKAGVEGMQSGMLSTYPWPPPPDLSVQDRPVWTGHGFSMRDALTPILSYGGSSSGWSDELTGFHEETAGTDHPIDRASRQYALEQLHRYLKGEHPVILDAGCSSGFMLHLIREKLPHASIIGSDVVRGPLEQLAAKMPDIPLLQFDLVRCPLPDNSIDAVVLLNVLEHITDDAAALRQVYRILKPGGIAVIEVPAGPHLYDVYDKLLLHCRRYSLTTLCSLAKNIGFRIARQSHLGFFAYPGFWLVKWRNKRFLSQEKALQRRIVESSIRDTGNSHLLNTIMHVELALGRWISYPFGIRCLLTCVKVA